MLTMRTGKLQFGKRFCCLAIIAVAMWLGGFGCALCCGIEAADRCCERAASSHQTVQRAGHDCCATDSSNPSGSISNQAGMKDCSLLPNQATSLAVIPRADEAPALPEEQTLPLDDIIAPSAFFISARLPQYRGSQYLRCCSLLI